jgi:hypothetical protein
MILQPIVEGHGEVLAVPALLRRLVHNAAYPDVTVATSIRAHRSDLVQKAGLEKYISLARIRGSDAILVLFDGDDDCPAELVKVVGEWARVAAIPIPCEVVMAAREYEAWFLASINSLRGERGIAHDARVDPTPEAHRDAKGLLRQKMLAGRFYVERTDQVALTSHLDLPAVYNSCRSFRRMVKAFGSLVSGCGLTLDTWPPKDW